MREACRLQKNELQEKLSAAGKSMVIFFIYTGKEIPDQTTVHRKISSILKAVVDECAS
jgi:ribonuclease P protein component